MIGDYPIGEYPLAQIGSGVIDIAVGATPAPVAVPPRAEVVASAPDAVDPWVAELCGMPGIDRRGLGWHSRAVYARMDDCPPVGASFNALRAAVLAGKVDLIPAVDDTAAAGDDADAALAAEVCASNRRTIRAMDTALDLVLHEVMGEAMKFGHSIPELVFDDVRGGPDAGLWYVRAIKPRRGCTFRVDRGMNVVGIAATTYAADGTTEHRVLDPAHFAPLAWDMHHGDPRGRSCYRMAVDAWRRLEELWPDCMEGWKDFGRPFLVGTAPPNMIQDFARDDQGKPIPGKPALTPPQQMARSLQGGRRNRNLGLDHGATVDVVESQKDSSIVAGAIGELEAQIVKAILLQTRATIEAKHGSRADSETGENIMGAMVRFIRKWLERWVRSVLMRQNELNYGPDLARRLTPLVDLGSTEHQDFAANAAAVAQLAAAGIIQPSQYPAIFLMLGMTAPTKEEIAALTAKLQAAPADPAAPPEKGVAA